VLGLRCRADTCWHGEKPEPAQTIRWDVYKVAKKAVWLATVEAPDKSAAIGKAAQEFKTEAWAPERDATAQSMSRKGGITAAHLRRGWPRHVPVRLTVYSAPTMQRPARGSGRHGSTKAAGEHRTVRLRASRRRLQLPPLKRKGGSASSSTWTAA
jgi:hypothetical protein